MRRPCYSFQTSKLNIVAVSSFFDASFPWNFFFNFHQTLTVNNSGLKSSKLENYNIFGILGEVILVEIIENNAFSFHESN